MQAEAIPILPPDDHRALARRLDLCHFQDEAPGMAFWHPRGWTLYRLLEDAARHHVLAGGYLEVNTPQLLRRSIWQTSGHWDAFANGMFAFGAGDEQAALKPVSCPGHIQIVKRMAPSWRDLPLRIAEFGRVHRDEPSGTLHGLMRLRQFSQDDGHIFCTEAQLADEIARFCRELPAFYARFGFTEIAVALSLRPADRIGDDATWDRAEQILGDVAASLGVPVEAQPGAGAIYGPKLEFALRDRRGRAWQCGTIQLDFAMPQRFDLRYVDAGGEKKLVAMLHRALFGSIERFLGILLEHHGASLPAWLAPQQVAIVPIAERHRDYAERIRAALGVRARIDTDDTLARRVAIAHHDGVPMVAIVGDRDVAGESISIRDRDAQVTLPFADAIARMRAACYSQAWCSNPA